MVDTDHGVGYMMVRKYLAFSFLCFFLITGEALATRTVYFQASGQNVITDTNVKNAVTPSCTIIITNPSSNSQSYTFTYTISSDAGSATGVNNPTPSPYTLTAGSSDVWVFNYPAIAAGTAVTQSLVCNGQINASDSTSGSPGYLLASGNLITAYESTGSIRLSGNGAVKGTAVMTQMPILINAGRPF